MILFILGQWLFLNNKIYIINFDKIKYIRINSISYALIYIICKINQFIKDDLDKNDKNLIIGVNHLLVIMFIFDFEAL